MMNRHASQNEKVTAEQHNHYRGLALALEYGFKCCEKGMNLEATQEAYWDLIGDKK